MISYFWICRVHHMCQLWVNYCSCCFISDLFLFLTCIQRECCYSHMTSVGHFLLEFQVQKFSTFLSFSSKIFLCEVCGTAENSLYQSEPDRLYSSIPCISTESARYTHYRCLLWLGRTYFTSSVTMLNNPLKKIKNI